MMVGKLLGGACMYSSWNIRDRAPSVTIRNSVAEQRPRILGGQFLLSRLYRWYTPYEYFGEISKCDIPIVEFVPSLLVTVLKKRGGILYNLRSHPGQILQVNKLPL